MVKTTGNTPSEFDHELEKGSPGHLYLTGKLHGADKGLEVH